MEYLLFFLEKAVPFLGGAAAIELFRYITGRRVLAANALKTEEEARSIHESALRESYQGVIDSLQAQNTALIEENKSIRADLGDMRRSLDDLRARVDNDQKNTIENEKALRSELTKVQDDLRQAKSDQASLEERLKRTNERYVTEQIRKDVEIDTLKKQLESREDKVAQLRQDQLRVGAQYLILHDYLQQIVRFSDVEGLNIPPPPAELTRPTTLLEGISNQYEATS